MHRFVVLAVVVVVAGAGAVSGRARPGGHTWGRFIIHATVNADGTVLLRDGVGHLFTTGLPGMYLITVTDRSTHDDFHLTGPGVDVVVSGRQFVGGTSIDLALHAGSYRYRSDSRPHSPGRTFVLKQGT